MKRLSAFFFVTLTGAVASAQPAAEVPPPDAAAPDAPAAETPATTPPAEPAPTLGLPGGTEVPASDGGTAPAAPIQAAAPEPKMPPGPATPIKIESASSSMKLGFLLQPQFESVGHPSRDGMSHNLFVRRIRLLFGGTLFKDIEYFIDTDFADAMKGNADSGIKATPGINILDAYGTYKVLGDALKVDLGYMLPPLSHNALQGATTLYSWDYFNNAFRHTAAFGSSGNPIGRDVGAQLRGLVADGLLEYRAGLFQGRREPATADDASAQNFFRVAARLQLNLLDPETGFFYAGTYLGAKRIASLGVSYDFQDDYRYIAGDAFVDMELGPGVLTAQVNVAHMDGDDWLVTSSTDAMGNPTVTPALPKQTSIMGEAGYLFYSVRVSPIFRFERQMMDEETIPDETRIGGGIAFWPYAHNFNLKAFYTRVTRDPAPHGFNQFNLQAQFFLF